MRETWVWYLGWEDLLKKGTATNFSILAWRIPWTVYSTWGRKELDMTEWLELSISEDQDPEYQFSTLTEKREREKEILL